MPIQAMIFVFSAILYVFLVACVLPKVLLHPTYDLSGGGDRGLKKYVFEGGRAIAYEPSVSSGKYIKQYILSSNNDEKYIKCLIDKRLFSLKYDVVCFDSNEKIIETVQVSEPIRTPGVTHGALLPRGTSYVYVIVKEVNGMIAKDSPKLTFSLVKVGIFAAITVVLTVAEALILRAIALSFANILFSGSDKIGIAGGFGTVFVSAVIGVAVSGAILFLQSSKDTQLEAFKKF